MAGGRPETLTVVFTDLVASTAWRTRVGADVADAQTVELERGSRRIVSASGGTVVKSVGDGVMATFGSATAALEAATSLRALARQLAIGGSPACLRIGVSSGDLVREGDDWLGTAAIEAARLCAEVDGGSILVADTTAGLVRGRTRARLRPLDALLLRGFSESIDVFELVDVEPSGAALPVALARAADTQLVGRRAELEHLATELAAVAAGAARCVFVVGEPGVGKTRLAAAVATEADRQGFAVLHGRCDEGLGAPYQPVVEAFRPRLDSNDAVASTVVDRPGLIALWPELGAGEEQAPDAVTEPEVQRWRLFEDVAELAGTVAAERPVLLVIDDLQWAEPSARALLGHLVRHDLANLFVLATVRPDPSTPDLSALLGDVGTERFLQILRLEGLPEPDVAALIGAHAAADPPVDLVRRLREETDGNPFFLRALLAHLDDVAFIRDAGGSWVSPAELDAVGIPHGARAVIRRRIRTLGEAPRRALEAGAVCGLTFEQRTIGTVLDATVDELVTALEAAMAVGLVREDAAGRFTFLHALVRHALLDDLSRTALARLHWRIADALAADRRRQPVCAIAVHYTAGREFGSAETLLEAATAAGQESMQRLAFEEAAGHFRTALSALDELDPDPDARYELVTALGGALNALAEGDVGDDLWLEAADIAQQARDPVRLHAAILGYLYMIRVRPPEELSAMIDALLGLLPPGDSALRATTLGLRGMAWIGGDLSRATAGDLRLANEAVEMARRVGDPQAVALTLRSRLNLFESSGTDASAILRDAEELVALRQLEGGALRLETGAEWRDLARGLIRCGRAPDADLPIREARDAASRTGERMAMNAAIVIESGLAAARGRFADARRLAEEAFAAVSGVRGRLETLRYGAQLVAVMMEQGQLEDVIPLLRQVESYDIVAPEWLAMLATALADDGQRTEAAEVLDRIDLEMVFNTPRFGKPLAVRHLPEACRLLDDRDLATALLPHLAPWSGQILLVNPGSSIDGAADRSLGHVHAVLGRSAEADAWYAAAADLERTAELPTLLARTEYWHARLLLERDGPGDRDRADGLLDDVVEITGAIGMARLHGQAVELRAGRGP